MPEIEVDPRFLGGLLASASAGIALYNWLTQLPEEERLRWLSLIEIILGGASVALAAYILSRRM